jgi:hypothetical protein
MPQELHGPLRILLPAQQAVVASLLLVSLVHAGETLPNGIVLPVEWPPRIEGDAGRPPLQTFIKPGSRDRGYLSFVGGRMPRRRGITALVDGYSPVPRSP